MAKQVKKHICKRCGAKTNNLELCVKCKNKIELIEQFVSAAGRILETAKELQWQARLIELFSLSPYGRTLYVEEFKNWH